MPTDPEYRVVTDQIGRTISVPNFPKRIISLVPSQTELLFDLGLDQRVAGITKFCIHPREWYSSKPRIGGTKNVNIESVQALNPDLIIANKEENEKKDIELLSKEFPVWVSDVIDLDSALEMIASVGVLTNSDSSRITQTIKEGFNKVSPIEPKIQTLYLIWKRPFMAAGTGTFINHMLAYCGFENVLSEPRYPELSISEIQNLDPQLVLLSSEPYPFKQKHLDELKSILPMAKLILVDGEMFSWYGSRLLSASKYFNDLILSLK